MTVILPRQEINNKDDRSEGHWFFLFDDVDKCQVHASYDNNCNDRDDPQRFLFLSLSLDLGLYSDPLLFLFLSP